MSIRLRILLLAVSMLSVFGNVLTATAQDSVWTCSGPYEASIWDIAIDPTDNTHMYIGTLESFVYQTTDGGAEWSRIKTEGSPDLYFWGQNVYDVVIHPFGPDTMFIDTGMGAYKSTDGGETWSQMFPQRPHDPWSTCEINRSNPPVLFLGTWGSAWRSTDCGRNWIQMGWLSGAIEEIKSDPVRPNIIYAANNTTIPNASIWKSTDSGRIWQSIHHNLGRSFDENNPIYGRAIEVDPVNPDIIYFGRYSYLNSETDTVLVKSTDGGESWIDITPRSLLSSYYIIAIAVSPLDHNVVLVCTDNDGVLRSTDGGTTWEEANQGIIGASHRALSLTFDHQTGLIYLGGYIGGVYCSSDNGVSWEKISHGITAATVYYISANSRHPDTLFTSTYNGLYMSTNGAASWQYVELNFPKGAGNGRISVKVDPFNSSYIYAGYYGRFYRSSDGGTTWETFSQGLDTTEFYGSGIAVAKIGNARRLFMGSYDGLFSSDDLGESWSHCEGDLPSSLVVGDVQVSPADSSLVFVGKFGGILYKSTNGGESWQALPNSLLGGIKKIACDPRDPSKVYIIAGESPNCAIYKSTDGGSYWHAIDGDIPFDTTRYQVKFFSGLAVNPLNPDNIFATSFNKGLFQSHVGGHIWENLSLNLDPSLFNIGCTVIDPVDTSRIFLGLVGGSVWTIRRTPVDAAGQDDILPNTFSSTSYPNPFNTSATIEYSLPKAGHVKVEVFDILGQRVAILVDETQEAGSHKVVWDAKEQSSGAYFYRVDAGESSRMEKMILLK